MKKVYKNRESELALKALYDKQLASLNIDYEEIYLDTRYGTTHAIKTGNPTGKPILLFHGGNSTTPYYLRGFLSLREKYCLYAVDTMGHPGKSAETVLSAKSLEYGIWASDVIAGLGFDRMICMGGSYGGGVLTKLMCAAPEKVEKSILIVPSGINNVTTTRIAFEMGIPMMLYVITKQEQWLKKAILPISIHEENIDEDTLEMVRASFEHACVKAGMPSNANPDDMKKCTAPTLLIAAERDCLFPGRAVIERGKAIIPNLKTHLLKESGHLCVLSDEVMTMIDEFISE